MAGDGQVTLGNTIVKHQAKKVRRLYKDRVITGFAGATTDAFTLFGKIGHQAGTERREYLKPATPVDSSYDSHPINAIISAGICASVETAAAGRFIGSTCIK